MIQVLINIFQMGWNHQLALDILSHGGYDIIWSN